MAERGDDGRFLTGNKGGGRPKGARNKLGEALLADCYEDWLEHGTVAIRRMREERPGDYVRMMASLLPREVKVEVSEFGHLSEDDLTNELRRALTQLGREGIDVAGLLSAEEIPDVLN